MTRIYQVLKGQNWRLARRRETIGDLDIVFAVKPEDVETVTNEILSLKGIADVKGAGDSKVSVILDTSIFEDGFSRAPRCECSRRHRRRVV